MTGWAWTGRLLGMTSDAERIAIAHVAQSLSARFPDIAPTLVARVVQETHDIRDPPDPRVRSDSGRGRRSGPPPRYRAHLVKKGSTQTPRDQSASDRPMVIAVIGSMMSARNATMSSRSRSSVAAAGSCSDSSSSSLIRSARRSAVARRQLWLMWSYRVRTAVALTRRYSLTTHQVTVSHSGWFRMVWSSPGGVPVDPSRGQSAGGGRRLGAACPGPR